MTLHTWRRIGVGIAFSIGLVFAAGDGWAACSVSNPPPASTATLLGTQTADQAVILGGCIDGAVIGSNNPVAGTFTSITVVPANGTAGNTLAMQSAASGFYPSLIVLGDANADLALAPNGAGTLRVANYQSYRPSQGVKTSVGPGPWGANGIPLEWLVVKNYLGQPRYIPLF